MVKRFLKNIEYKTKKDITMDTKIFLTYRILIVLSVIAIIKRTMMMRKASEHTKYYANYVFWICTGVAFLNHFCFVLCEFGDFYGMSFDDLGTGHIVMMCYFFMASACFTIGQFIFSGKYATYHIVYAPTKEENVCDHCQGELILREDDKPETVQKRLQFLSRDTMCLSSGRSQEPSLSV